MVLSGNNIASRQVEGYITRESTIAVGFCVNWVCAENDDKNEIPTMSNDTSNSSMAMSVDNKSKTQEYFPRNHSHI